MSSNQALKASSGTSSAGTSRLARLLKHGPPTTPPHLQKKTYHPHVMLEQSRVSEGSPFGITYLRAYIYIYMYNIQFGLQRWQALLLVNYCFRWHLVFAMYSSRLMLAPFALLPNFFAAT